MKWRYQTLVEALDAAGHEPSQQKGFTFLNGAAVEHLPFDELGRRAKIYAGALQHQGVQRGNRVLVVLPTGVEFACVYLGVLLCGAAPCVLPSPEGAQNQDESISRLCTVAQQLAARILVTTMAIAKVPALADAPFGIVTIAELTVDPSHAWQPVPVTGDDLALIQASSGTTGRPKCVALSHANILANVQQIGQRLQIDNDVVVCWLPLYHDMGLIGCFLFVLAWQLHGVFMSPYRFLRRPANWLKAISEYGGTLSPAPNFAYALATQRITERELIGIDLATWRGALCGAEPIDVGTLQAFARRFSAYGFRPTSLLPCYGLAEASLCVVLQQPGAPLHYERISRRALAGSGVAVDVDTADAGDATVVCDCGTPVGGMRVRIADDAGRELPDGHVGSVWVSGPSITRGYYNAPDDTRAARRDGWLNTADLGYMRNGHLFITGRWKDLIVIRGHNYQPTDFERVAAEVPGVSFGGVVAVGVYHALEGTEQLYLVCERPRDMPMDDAAFCTTISVHVGRRTGIVPAQVVLVKRNSIPKTTSGKLQRVRTKLLYIETSSKEAAAA